MASAQILLVEDDEDDYILALDYLEEITFVQTQVTRAKDAHEALEHLKQNHYDLCLLDYQLGAINGIEVLRQARLLGFSAPIIMLTGQANEELDDSAVAAGADDYLIKNELNSSRFARAIRYALARREIEHERVERLKAESDNRTKNRFLAHLSHELRTPLTAILGYTELLLHKPEAEDTHPELEVILRNGRHLLSLLNDVLDLSKIEANKLELVSGPVMVESLIADIYTLMKFVAQDKGLKLSIRSKNIPLQINTDPTRIRQVLINLINNALKFTDEGEITITIYTQTSDKNYFCVDVKDTGVGIAKDQQDKIFKPFEQVADVISKSVGGSGLGLAISYELAKRMGGDITVESTLGEGSCFKLKIDPGDISDSAREDIVFNELAPSAKIEQTLSLTGRVLVVDDLRDIRRLVGFIVESTGATVTFAQHGAQAIHKISEAKDQNEPFDLVLMDIHMPVMDGKRAVNALRESGETLPIIALTAASMKGTEDKLKKIGFSDVLSKPIDKPKLMRVLKQQLSKYKKETSASIQPASVLLLEDDDDAANAISMLLTSLGLNVESYKTIAAAKNAINCSKYDGVLLDLNLPDGSGLEIAQWVNTQQPQCYVCLLTGNDVDKALTQTYKINQVYLKPLGIKELKKIVTDITTYSESSA